MNYVHKIILILAIIIIVCYFYTSNELDEQFMMYGPNLKYCSTCGYKSVLSCSACSNCGMCYPIRGAPECVDGDANGPYFREDCATWKYNDIENSIYPNYGYASGYYQYDTPVYRKYYGNNSGKRISHHHPI